MPMSPEIQSEGVFFLICVACGILLLFGYDLLRVWRQILPHGTFFLAVEDFIYWSMAGIVCFAVVFTENSGRLRGFTGVGILAGMMLYHKSVSQFVFKGILWTIRGILKIFSRILRVLFYPILFLSKRVKKDLGKLLKKSEKEGKMTILKK